MFIPLDPYINIQKTAAYPIKVPTPFKYTITINHVSAVLRLIIAENLHQNYILILWYLPGRYK